MLGILVSFAEAQQIEIEAIAGKPFGVGRIVLDLPESMLPQPFGVEGLALTERDNRVLYPTIDSPAFGKIMKEVLESDTPLTRGGPVREQVGGLLRGILDRPPRTTIYFLFRGEEPLQITLQAKSPIPIPVIPRHVPAAYQRLLAQWWRQYAQPPQLLEQKPDYPPQVENYLTTTLAVKLNLRLPEAKQTNSPHADLQKEIGLNLGTESIRVALQQDRILGLNNLDMPADQPLPDALEPPPLEFPEQDGEVKIEPLVAPRSGRMFLPAFRQFQQFPLAARHAGQMGRRHAKPRRTARLGPPDARSHGKATRAQTDRSFQNAGPNRRFRRGDYRHRHVLPRRGRLRLLVRGPQYHHSRRKFHRPTRRAHQGRRRNRAKNQNRRS